VGVGPADSAPARNLAIAPPEALMPVILAALLVLSLVALGGAAIRLASVIAPAGLERALVVAVLLAAAAVIEALALGLVALGGTPAALATAAVLTWLAARIWLPEPERSPWHELRDWWGGLPAVSRVGLGALAGATAAIALTLLHRPEPGFDGITYHLPEVVDFVQSGRPGAVFQAYYGLPIGNYPLTNEVLLSWLTGITHGYAAQTLWSPASALLLLAAGWLGLGQLAVPRGVRVLALAALLLGPVLFSSLAQPGTDLPALAWLACCGSLALAARDRPALLAPAVLALALAVGTKTTAGLYGALTLIAALWLYRARLRSVALPLALAVLAGLAAGGIWYVRNLLDHGSPLWPFYATPWGDPVPTVLKILSVTLAQTLSHTLLDHLSAYLTATAGSVVLLAGGILVAPLAVRRRPLIAAAVALGGTLAWANAPATGLPTGGILAGAVGSTVRYLMPVFAAGTVALALAASEGGRAARLAALATLAGALVWALQRDVSLSFSLPFTSWLAPGVAIGALAALASGSALAAVARARSGAARLIAPAAALICAVAGALVLAAGSSGYVARHAKVATELDAPVAAFLNAQPGFAHTRLAVAAAPVASGLLAGDRLKHPLSLIGERESCAQIRARARVGWVVVILVSTAPLPGHPGFVFPPPGNAATCLAPLPPVFQNGAYRVYGPRT
jgi:hypothetical protein